MRKLTTQPNTFPIDFTNQHPHFWDLSTFVDSFFQKINAYLDLSS